MTEPGRLLEAKANLLGRSGIADKLTIGGRPPPQIKSHIAHCGMNEAPVDSALAAPLTRVPWRLGSRRS